MLRAEGLVVRYGPRTAVDDVSLVLDQGVVTGLLGPNGAGKTTLLRRLAGLLPSQAGRVEIGSGPGPGADPATSAAARARIGYLPEDPPLYAEDTALQYVAYLAGLSGVARGRRRSEAEAALARVGAGDLAGRLTGRLSKGQRQRVALAGAIVHGPDLLLLDEPSEGLDPGQVVALRALLGQLKGTAAIVFSTHLLAEAQIVCDRVVVIDGGRIVLDRPVGAGAGLRLRVEVGGAPAGALAPALARVPGVRAIDAAVLAAAVLDAAVLDAAVLDAAVLDVDGPAVAEAVAETVLTRGWRLRHLAPAPDDLERAFLAAVAGSGVMAGSDGAAGEGGAR